MDLNAWFVSGVSKELELITLKMQYLVDRDETGRHLCIEKRREALRKMQPTQLTEAENNACWAYARRVAKQVHVPSRIKKIANLKFTCDKCGESYCIDGTFKELKCDICYIPQHKELIEAEGGIYVGCIRTHMGIRTCVKCGGENERDY